MIEIIDKPSIVLTKIKFNYNPTVTNESDLSFNTEQIGKYPYIYINGVIIEADRIKNLVLYNNKIVPKLEMEFTDPTSKILDDNFPSDDSIVSVFINSDNDKKMHIRMDFKIFKFFVIKSDKNSNAVFYKLVAYLDNDNLYNVNNMVVKGSSFDVMKKLSKDSGLGFASNIRSSDDSMTWINRNDYIVNFILDTALHSYISDESFLFSYIDFYYNLNYVDIEKALQENTKEQKNITDINKIIPSREPQVLDLKFSNHPDNENTNMFISNYTLDNSSTEINISYGYNNLVCVYNIHDAKYNAFELDTISDEASGNNIVMKGKMGTKKGLYTDLIKSQWMGKYDTDNMHKNYHYAELQNKNNLMYSQKLKMTIRLNRPNYNIYRFQKILVELYNLSKPDEKADNNSTGTVKQTGKRQFENKIIHKLSGEWLITGINFIFDRNSGNYQEVTLIKRELTDKYIFK